MSTTTRPRAADERTHQHRTFTATVLHAPTGANMADGIEVAISSEAAVERFDYATGQSFLEVLDHTPNGPDLSYARDGLPFLLDHDLGRQVGILRDVRVDSDRRIRGRLMPGNHPDAEWLFQDIAAGVRNKVSIGYWPGSDYEEIASKRGEPPVRRYRGWTLYEASSVAVPADYSVGVGRAHSDPNALSSVTNQRTYMDPTVISPDTRAQELAALARNAGMPEKAAEWITTGASVENARTEVLTALRTKADSRPNITGGFPGLYAAETREDRHASREFDDAFREAIFAPDGSAARQHTSELARELGIAPRGNLVGLSTRTITTTGVGSGKEFTPVLQGDFVDLMRPRMIAALFGAQIQTYQGGTVSRPTITADAAVTWLAENPGSGVVASDQGTGAITMQPRAIATRTTHTAQSLRTSTPETPQIIKQAHAARLAVGVDAAVLAGTGTSNQPTGILNNASVNLVAMGTNGGPVTYAKLCELEQAIDLANAPVEGLGFVTTPQIRSRMRQTQDFPSAAAGRPLWDAENRVMGHQALTTTSMPSNLTKGTSSGVCHAAILGDFSQVVIAYWGALEVIVDPYSSADRGLTHITSILYVDVGVLQPGAFAVIRDLTLA